MISRNNIPKLLAAVLLSALLILSAALPSFAAYPAHSDNIYDGPDALSESTERQIRKVNSESKSGTTISVCVVPGTDGKSIGEYATGLFSAWELGEGVLIVIDTSASDYYIIQSSGIEDRITTADLESVRDNYFEPDFSTGNIDSAVSKAVTKLSIDMASKLAPASDGEKEEAGSAPTFGSVIATIFKVILILVIIAVVVFAILFVIALFNDDVAAILRTYVFDRFRKKDKTRTNVPQFDYDERLYGNRQQSQRPRNSQQSGNRQAGGYPQGGAGTNRQGNYQRYPQQNSTQNRNSRSSNNGGYYQS